jgi:hypothetical protein
MAAIGIGSYQLDIAVVGIQGSIYICFEIDPILVYIPNIYHLPINRNKIDLYLLFNN